jgi:hypothetical protein
MLSQQQVDVMSGQEKAVVGVIGAVVVLLFILLFWPRADPPPKQNRPDVTSSPDKIAEAPAPEEPRPMPERRPEPVQPPQVASIGTPEKAPEPQSSDAPPPPVTGLILTFPSELSEGEMDVQIAKCNAVVSRRRGVYVKVQPDRGSSYEAIKRCFKYSEVSVQEERGAPPTP